MKKSWTIINPKVNKQDMVDKQELLSEFGCGSWQLIADVHHGFSYPRLKGSSEFLLVGRSNVGKSSLINALVNQKSLARASTSPGRTRSVIFFAPTKGQCAHTLRLIDMPGYGYSKIPGVGSHIWQNSMKSYLSQTVSLRRVLFIIDARRDLTQDDKEVLKIFNQSGVLFQFIVSKADKITSTQLDTRIKKLIDTSQTSGAALESVIATSVNKKKGIDDLRKTILNATKGSI